MGGFEEYKNICAYKPTILKSTLGWGTFNPLQCEIIANVQARRQVTELFKQYTPGKPGVYS
jgi:hypothetical protein